MRQQQPEAWREAHLRLYEHLRSISGFTPNTLEELQPLYHAVFHGCAAGEYETALSDYYNRIQRRNQYYATNQLGAFGADLSTLACFFDSPWTHVVSDLSDQQSAFILRQTAFCLRAVTRVNEAAQAACIAVERSKDIKDWLGATMAASMSSDLQLLLGNVNEAIHLGRQATEFADSQDEDDRRLVGRVFQANALHQAGRRAEALVLFRAAEEIQSIRRPDTPLLQSILGYFYCELLLADLERTAWKYVVLTKTVDAEAELKSTTEMSNSIIDRASQTLNSATIRGRGRSIADIAATQLTIARCNLFKAIVQGRTASSSLALHEKIAHVLGEALASLRQSGQRNFLPTGLLTRAWMRFLEGQCTGPESAQSDLDEAWEIAERGPMPLLLADIHLHRARLFFREQHYPWKSPLADLAEARRLIRKHGYWRRKEELEDAEMAIRLP